MTPRGRQRFQQEDTLSPRRLCQPEPGPGREEESRENTPHTHTTRCRDPGDPRRGGGGAKGSLDARGATCTPLSPGHSERMRAPGLKLTGAGLKVKSAPQTNVVVLLSSQGQNEGFFSLRTAVLSRESTNSQQKTRPRPRPLLGGRQTQARLGGNNTLCNVSFGSLLTRGMNACVIYVRSWQKQVTYTSQAKF